MKTDWNALLGHYKGSHYKMGDVIKYALAEERNGQDVPGVLSLVALQFPFAPVSTWGLADKSIDFARFEPAGQPFESGTYDQIKTIGRLTRNAQGDPLAVAMALMPDAHPGYGMPIGGVVALANAVSPNFVGVDIACRMTLSTWAIKDLQTAIDAIRKIARFGFAANEGDNAQDHPVMHDPLWRELPILRGLKDKAYAQLGTSGSGNHFIDLLEIVGGYPGHYALLTHSGSRGVGAKVGKHYELIAKDVCPGKVPDGYWWMPMDGEAGQEYFAVMNLMGRYAQACHHLIHARFAIAAGATPRGKNDVYPAMLYPALGLPDTADQPNVETSHRITAVVDGVQQAAYVNLIENYHNFAWKETWPGVGDVYIHRKGATPAASGQWGIIPGSSGSNSYVVVGTKGTPGQAWTTENLNSASHGAGRPRSRTASKNIHDPAAYAKATQDYGVIHEGVAPDETKFAYKNIDDVMAAQAGHVRIQAALKPVYVKMGGMNSDDGD